MVPSDMPSSARSGVVRAYAVAVYALSLATFAVFVGFVENLGVPRSIDVGPARSATVAWLIDVGLIVLFGVQHSVMARAGFKRAWTRVIPAAAERSTYVLVTTGMVILLMAAWTPIPRTIWHVAAPAVRFLAYAGSFSCWSRVLCSPVLIDHLDMFGLRPAPESGLRTPLLYKLIRHPLYLGFIIAFWCAPTMTVGHAMLAMGMTAYIFVGIAFEE